MPPKGANKDLDENILQIFAEKLHENKEQQDARHEAIDEALRSITEKLASNKKEEFVNHTQQSGNERLNPSFPSNGTSGSNPRLDLKVSSQPWDPNNSAHIKPPFNSSPSTLIT
ncbi:hypothetical protein Lal_00021783 [Lupinus albus]|nr:hypothetical protein Lal_00021783 [Lupinus albus]